MFLLFLLIAVCIALIANFGEILSKNESRIIRDIINPYLFIYLIINGFFAGLTYYFLPDVAKFVLKPEYASWAQGETWGRVLIAAFGYLVIVRAKFITIKDTPIGIDTLYDTFAQYCLRHTNMRIMIRQDQILDNVFSKVRRFGALPFCARELDSQRPAKRTGNHSISARYYSGLQPSR